MPLAKKDTYSKQPRVYSHTSRLMVYEFCVPYSGNQQSWRERVLSTARLTNLTNEVLGQDNFNKPAATGSFTLLLVESGIGLTRGCGCADYANEQGIYPASPYHVLDALEHLGSVKRRIKWWGRAGPGILAADGLRRGLDYDGFGIWYPEGAQRCAATIMSFYEALGRLTIFAFVKEPWREAHRQAA